MVEAETRDRIFEILLTPKVGDLPADRRLPRELVDLMSLPARPGRGGRQPRIPAGFETKATAELRKQLGSPTVFRNRGAELQLWEENPEGDGALVARLSTKDVQKGETSLAQIHGCRELCKWEGLTPRYILVATKQSGESSFENRLDFQFLKSAIERDELNWVMYREPDRIARNGEAAGALFRNLQSNGVDLYLTDMGRKMNWTTDKLILTTMGGVAEYERTQLAGRTGGALQRRWAEEGRGWPATEKFGFRRTKDKYLEVDPEQWGFIERIHRDYAGLCDPSGRGSLKKLREHIAQQGCLLSKEKVRQILWDPIYTTGEWGVYSKKDGTYYPGRTVEIENPIPAELMAKNQALLRATRGNVTRTPLGTFLLNHVDLVHAKCMNTPVERESGEPKFPRLRGRNYNGRRARRPKSYNHEYPVPPGCRRYTVPAEELDEAVVDLLLELAGSSELQRSYALAASMRTNWVDKPEDLAPLRRGISDLKRSRAQLLRQFTDSGKAGDLSEAETVKEMLQAFNTEIKSLEARIEIVRDFKKTEPSDASAELVESMRRVLRPGDNPTTDQRQRRVALIQTLVSRVIVHDTDWGLEIEVEGALVPDDQSRIPIGVGAHFDEALKACHKPATKGDLSGRSVTGLFGGVAPVWRSRRVPVGVLPYTELTVETLCKMIRWVDERTPSGKFFRKDGENCPWDDAVSGVPQIPNFRCLISMCHGLGTSTRALIRQALGWEEAIRKGRVGPKTEDEITHCFWLAMNDGFGEQLNWREWNEFGRSKAYMPTQTMLCMSAREIDVPIRDLFAAALSLRQGEVENKGALPALRAIQRRKNLVLSSCYSIKQIEVLGFPVWKIRRLRKQDQLVSFNVSGIKTVMYPQWQFLPGAQIHPVAVRIAKIVKDYGVLFIELHDAMNGEGSPPRPSTKPLAKIHEESDWDWIVQSVRDAVEPRSS